MKRLIIVLTMAVTLSGCFGEPVIDASSEDAFTTSTAKVSESLSLEDQDRFAEAWVALIMSEIIGDNLFDFAARASLMGSPNMALAQIKPVLHGKTGSEIIAAFEKLQADRKKLRAEEEAASEKMRAEEEALKLAEALRVEGLNRLVAEQSRNSLPEVGLNQWGITEHKDPINDRIRVLAGLVTEEGLLFFFQCSESKLVVVIVSHSPLLAIEFITMDRHADVSWRVDDLPAVKESWLVVDGKAGSNSAVLKLNPNNMVRSILEGKDKLTIRVHGITSIISLSDSKYSLEHMLGSCGL